MMSHIFSASAKPSPKSIRKFSRKPEQHLLRDQHFPPDCVPYCIITWISGQDSHDSPKRQTGTGLKTSTGILSVKFTLLYG